MGARMKLRRWILGASILSLFVALTGCGPNDRLRDNYMGKPKPEAYKPIKRDAYGNPILPEQDRTNNAEEK